MDFQLPWEKDLYRFLRLHCCPAPKPIVQQPHVYLGNSGLRLWCHTTISSTTKKVSKDELKFGLSVNHWGYLPNHCVHDLCLSRSFLLFFGANISEVGWQKCSPGFTISRSQEIIVSTKLQVNIGTAFGGNQGGFPLHQNTKHFFEKDVH